MAKPADRGTKRLIGLAPDAWAQWVTQRTDVQAREVLASEFQWVGRDTDALIRAFSPQDGEFLIVNEVQLRYALTVPRRVQAYAALAEEKYGLPVYPVLMNILPPPSTITVVDHYESNFMGLLAQRYFRVINLWEVDVGIVFTQPLAALLPFVPVLRGGGDEQVIRQALHVLRQDTKLQELETLLAFFASFVLQTQLVQQIMRWDMVVLEQSPWYQEIYARGEQVGLERGQQVGRQEGEQIGQAFILQRLLQKRFGALPPDVPPRLQGLTADAIETLLDVTLTATALDEVLAHLPAPAAPPPAS